MKTALITGITGQDGFYLSHLLLEKGYKVYGMYRKSVMPIEERVPGLDKRVQLVEGDLRDSASITSLIKKCKPDEIYNLAAQSFLPTAWDQPELTCDVNGFGVLRILEAIRIVDPKIKLYQASSREIFGVPEESPQTEKTPIDPLNPYAAAKAFAQAMINSYRKRYGMFISTGIAFNHESPRRGKEFVTRIISDGVAKIKLGIRDSLSIGNLEAKRDWGFAGDYVEFMWLSLQHESPEDYILATGETHRVRDFIEEAFNFVGMPLTWKGSGKSEVGIYRQKELVKINPKYYRPEKADWLFGDIRKAKELLGWEPKTKFKGLVRMMVKSDIEKLKKEVK